VTWEFRPIQHADLPMLHEWLRRPHVAEWWGKTPSMEEMEEEFLPIIAGNPNHRCFIARRNGNPTGFIQFYVAAAFHDEGWWLDEHDPGVRGIDQFLAHPDELNKGYGTQMVKAFVKMIFSDPSVTRIQTDPVPGNARAIRCYEKAGFAASHEADTPGGRGLIMYCERPQSL
jgi:RimJ/RimL family protein N-acetyltransferase